MTNKLENALELSDLGFFIFPILPNSKKPAVNNWPHQASNNTDKIKQWWSENPDYNIGINCSHFNLDGDDVGLLVVDVDVKKDKNGLEEIERLKSAGYSLAATWISKTPSGGYHYIYTVNQPVKQGVNILGDGLDIRSRGGYIVAPGSKIGEYDYHWVVDDDVDLVAAPDWIVHQCGDARTKTAMPAPSKTISPDALGRCQHFLEFEADIAIEGDAGDETTYKIAAKCKDFGLSEGDALDSMLEFWNPRCEPPWSYGELARKVANAYRYGTNEPGALAPENDFNVLELEQPELKNSPVLSYNNEYAFVTIGDKHAVFHETLDADNRKVIRLLSEAAFHKRHASERIFIKDKEESLTRLWMSHKKRRSFEGLCFVPERDHNPNYYNLWRGYTVQPSGNCNHPFVERWRHHLLNNVCDGIEKDALWLTAWFANVIQKPYEKPAVAVVLKGLKGVGKNILFECVGELFRSNYMVTAERRYLTGRFNSHLENCLMLVLDEALWSGDKQAEGILKNLITDKTRWIERKGYEPYQTDNLTRVAIIGNEDWLVPASHDERRFAVFDVNENKRLNTKYFAPLYAALESKSEAALGSLLSFLKSFDVSQVNLLKAPNTKGLSQQKQESLDLIEEWWFSCVERGEFMHSGLQGWPETAPCHLIRHSFQQYWVKEKNYKKTLPSDIKIGRKLKVLCPPIKKHQTMVNGDRQNEYVVPDIEVAEAYRRKFLDIVIDDFEDVLS